MLVLSIFCILIIVICRFVYVILFRDTLILCETASELMQWNIRNGCYIHTQSATNTHICTDTNREQERKEKTKEKTRTNLLRFAEVECLAPHLLLFSICWCALVCSLFSDYWHKIYGAVNAIIFIRNALYPVELYFIPSSRSVLFSGGSRSGNWSTVAMNRFSFTHLQKSIERNH